MKNKININHILLVLLLAFISMFSISCCRDEVVAINELEEGDNEEIVEKGHDNWAKVEVIIRQGHLHGVRFHGNPEFDRPIVPIIQKIIFEQTPKGIKRTIDKGNTLKKDDQVIEVIAGPEGGARYSMELIYYNSSGERINYQYLTPEQLPIHQHFFTVNKYSNIKTHEEYKAPKTEYFTHLYSYVYRDTNPEDKLLGQGGELIKNNPVGLKGYFHFKAEAKNTRFNMQIRLNHFQSSKFDANGKYDEANNPSRRARLQSVTDFLQEISFVVIGYDGWATPEESKLYLKDLAEYYDITPDEAEDYLINSEGKPDNGTFWL